MATRKPTGRLGASSPTIKKLAQGYARAAVSGYKRNRDGGLDYMGTEGKRLAVWEKRISAMSGPTQKLVERQASKLFSAGIDRLSGITRDKSGKVVSAPKANTLRSTVVRRKPNTAGLTRSKPKESTMATKKKKAAPKKSKKAAPRNYGPKSGAYSQATLRKMKPGALVKLQDKLYAQARAMPKGKGKEQIGRRALQVQKAYNALSKASGGKDRYDLTLNRQRTGVGDG